MSVSDPCLTGLSVASSRRGERRSAGVRFDRRRLQLTDGAQNAFAADFHSRRRCAMSSARSSSLPPSSTRRSAGSARK
jgi:hypothetical protein